MKKAKVMAVNAMRLAAAQYNDATAFVTILQENDLPDYLINQPITVNTTTPAPKGSQELLFPPTQGIEINDLVYCNGLLTMSVVIGVLQNLDIPAEPFCTCPMKSLHDATLPQQGEELSTLVTISPPLDADLPVGSAVTFAISTPTTISYPDTVSSNTRGVPT